MIYKFKSKAASDLIMTEPVGDALLRAIGKAPGARGIVEASAIPAALQALEAAIAADEAAGGRADSASGNEEDDEDRDGAASKKGVRLRQRAWPLIELLKASQAEGADVVWGV